MQYTLSERLPSTSRRFGADIRAGLLETIGLCPVRVPLGMKLGCCRLPHSVQSRGVPNTSPQVPSSSKGDIVGTPAPAYNHSQKLPPSAATAMPRTQPEMVERQSQTHCPSALTGQQNDDEAPLSPTVSRRTDAQRLVSVVWGFFCE